MRFSDIIGHEDIKRALAGMADSGKIPHAIMFYENDGGGAMALVLAFLQYINCHDPHDGDSCGQCRQCNQNSKLIYPDVHFTFPITSASKVSGKVDELECDKFVNYWRELCLKNPYFLENEMTEALGIEKKQGLISTAEGKSILRKLSLFPVSDGYRAVVIWLPEKMNQRTANMLLKVIEEPAAKTLFLLITHSPEDVLQTISSRCVGIRVPPLSKEELSEAVTALTGADPGKVEAAVSMAGGSIGEAVRFVSGGEEFSEVRTLFENLMRALMSKDYMASLEAGEALAGMDSREKQKLFCNFAENGLRKIFMVQQDMEEIAGITPDESAFVHEAAAGCKKTFCRKAAAVFDGAAAMIDRNVNQKIIFTDLVNRLSFIV